MFYINFISYFRHQTEVFFSSLTVHRTVHFVVNTHYEQQPKQLTYCSLESYFLKKSIDLNNSMPYNEKPL